MLGDYKQNVVGTQQTSVEITSPIYADIKRHGWKFKELVELGYELKRKQLDDYISRDRAQDVIGKLNARILDLERINQELKKEVENHAIPVKMGIKINKKAPGG